MVLAMIGPSGEGSSQGSGGLGMFLPMIIVFAIFYFLLIRPQTKKQKDHQTMLNELKRGDFVITSGGIYGTIVGLTDHIIHLKIADKVKISVSKSAISGLAKEEEAAEVQ
ncbi:preprotein translocase subunit YajC [bacterium]|nr:preprotein translocase subunit YajC [bacterium]